MKLLVLNNNNPGWPPVWCNLMHKLQIWPRPPGGLHGVAQWKHDQALVTKELLIYGGKMIKCNSYQIVFEFDSEEGYTQFVLAYS